MIMWVAAVLFLTAIGYFRSALVGYSALIRLCRWVDAEKPAEEVAERLTSGPVKTVLLSVPVTVVPTWTFLGARCGWTGC